MVGKHMYWIHGSLALGMSWGMQWPGLAGLT